jgi:hypothetical protein
LKALAIAVIVWSVAARADEPREMPWAQGVSQDAQDRANALYEEGNELFARGAHADALAKYRAALELWDHPNIHFNAAVTLIRLDRILEAADDLDRALRFGELPFASPERYQQALDYRALVARQLVEVEASCTLAGAHVLLDGQSWFDCPGTQQKRVLAGQHALVAQRDGYLTYSRSLVLVGGTQARETIELVSLEHATMLRYPVPRWLPWTITGAGVAIAAGGIALRFTGDSNLTQFESEWSAACPMGCALATQPELADRRSRALLEKNIGLGLAIAGGAIALGGGAFVVWNRPIRVLSHLEIGTEPGGARVSVRWTR